MRSIPFKASSAEVLSADSSPAPNGVAAAAVAAAAMSGTEEEEEENEEEEEGRASGGMTGKWRERQGRFASFAVEQSRRRSSCVSNIHVS